MAADSDMNLGVGTPKDSLPAEVYCSNLSGGHSMCTNLLHRLHTNKQHEPYQHDMFRFI
jgi:hypothetical protein